MKITINNLPQSKKEIHISIPFEELKKSIDLATKKLGENVKIEGFREGKVPLEILKEKLGKDVILEEAIRIKTQEVYKKIVRDNNLEVIGSPKVDIIKKNWEEPVELKIEVTVLPEVKLPDYKKIASSVKRRKVEVKDSEIEDTLKWIQKSRAKFSAKITPVEKGDFVIFSYQSPEIAGGKEQKDQFVIGEGHLLPGIEEVLIGMKPQEEKEVQLTFPSNHIYKELAGKTIKLKIKVESVQKIELPQVNDEWARSLGNFENLENLKESVREGIKKEKENVESQRVQAEILEKIANKSEVEIPQILIDLETENTVNNLKERIPQTLGISFEQYLEQANLSEEKLRESLLPEVTKKIREFLVLQEIKKREGVKASNQEIEEEANKFLAQFGSPEEAEKVIDPQTLVNYTRERIENKKTLQLLERMTRNEDEKEKDKKKEKEKEKE